MDLQKITVKFFSKETEAIPLTAFIDIFHGWIQASDGVYHDVADYSHMPAGPGIVLVAQDANISIDETAGKRGLLYKQKARLAGSNPEKLEHVFRSALQNCHRIETEPGIGRKIEFQADEIEITINDRLIAPNTDEAFQEVKPELAAFLRRLYDDSKIFMERENDPRKTLTVRIKTSSSSRIATLLENLNGALTKN
jgi:hypothetical protein